MTSYSTNNEGTFIPASQRPDGTWRRARRVKDGYVPQEEVPLYESKGRQFAQRKANALPPGLCPEVVEAARKEREKKEKAKAKKEAAANKKQPIPGVLKLPANTSTTTTTTDAKKPIANGQKSKAPAATPPSTSNDLKTVDNLSENLANNLKVQDETQDLQKKCKKLQKKLREIDEIEKKLKSGALKKPEKDQLDKVARKAAIEKELQQVLAQMNNSGSES
ncbi:partner of Y14 and mago [Musca autumnalis]|uniref:partner of Y14 and mago n=1 Tax=Musca autumnalis TaxID=221902 RepID=UPI003CF39193